MNDAQTCGLLEETLSAKGVPAALDQLELALRQKGDFWGWFYSRLMRSRVAMGACPTPTAGSADLTPEQQETYEQAIREAAHMVGGAALEQGLRSEEHTSEL